MLNLQIEAWSQGGVVIRVQGEHEHYGSVWGADFTLERVDSTKGVDKLTLHGPNGILAILSGVVINKSGVVPSEGCPRCWSFGNRTTSRCKGKKVC